MKIKRKQTAGNIQFIVESHFKNANANSIKETLSKIMIEKANKELKAADKFKPQISVG